MSKHRIQIDVTGVNATKLNNFKTQLDAQLAGLDFYDRINDWVQSDSLNAPLRRELRFRLNNAAQAQAIEDWFRNNIQALRSLVNGTVSHHVCCHDDSPSNWYDCQNDVRANLRTVQL